MFWIVCEYRRVIVVFVFLWGLNKAKICLYRIGGFFHLYLYILEMIIACVINEVSWAGLLETEFLSVLYMLNKHLNNSGGDNSRAGHLKKNYQVTDQISSCSKSAQFHFNYWFLPAEEVHLLNKTHFGFLIIVGFSNYLFSVPK